MNPQTIVSHEAQAVPAPRTRSSFSRPAGDLRWYTRWFSFLLCCFHVPYPRHTGFRAHNGHSTHLSSPATPELCSRSRQARIQRAASCPAIISPHSPTHRQSDPRRARHSSRNPQPREFHSPKNPPPRPQFSNPHTQSPRHCHSRFLSCMLYCFGATCGLPSSTANQTDRGIAQSLRAHASLRVRAESERHVPDSSSFLSLPHTPASLRRPRAAGSPFVAGRPRRRTRKGTQTSLFMRQIRAKRRNISRFGVDAILRTIFAKKQKKNDMMLTKENIKRRYK